MINYILLFLINLLKIELPGLFNESMTKSTYSTIVKTLSSEPTFLFNGSNGLLFNLKDNSDPNKRKLLSATEFTFSYEAKSDLVHSAKKFQLKEFV